VCNYLFVARKYELKRRAERQEETRQRIVDAAIELHRTNGPARTTVSDIARLAGVQRHTFYRHFPDEWALGLACSGHFTATNPAPDPASWRRIADADDRLRVALRELYDYYARTGGMLASVLRDAETDANTRRLLELRHGEAMQDMVAALAELVTTPAAHALVQLAVDFRTWQNLVQHQGLSTEDAVDVMVRAVRAA
jgi:AcrR family transcriptional regulator